MFFSNIIVFYVIKGFVEFLKTMFLKSRYYRYHDIFTRTILSLLLGLYGPWKKIEMEMKGLIKTKRKKRRRRKLRGNALGIS
ncbi:hypothetical protein ACJX0J_024369, partial [Zea mays]